MYKYQGLVVKVNRMWKAKAKVMPIAVGLLRAVSILTDWLALLPIKPYRFDNNQQTALLRTANILRTVISF